MRGACLHIECFVFISLARPIWPDRMSFSRNGARRLILIVSLSEAQNIWAGSRLTCLGPKRRAGRLSYSERCLCWGWGYLFLLIWGGWTGELHHAKICIQQN